MRKIDRRCESRCAESTTRVVQDINAVPKLDRTSMKKLVSKHEKHCKTQLTSTSDLQLYDGKMKIDVPTSPQGVAVAKHRLRK